VLDWNSFNVGKDATVNFQQPNAQAATLNRVNDTQPSQILGRITAPGQVVLVNPQGVYFGKSSSVDVGGLVATTHNAANQEFMDGQIKLTRNGGSGKVENEGELRAALGGEVQRLTRLNKTRVNYAAQLERMIHEYNSGSANVEAFFEELLRLGRDLSEEVKRALRERLSEEELAVFDLITTSGGELPDAEREQVKTVARGLLGTLKSDRLVLDWRKKQQARARVRQAIRRELDHLPNTFPQPDYEQAVTNVYAHVYESYRGEGDSVYE